MVFLKFHHSLGDGLAMGAFCEAMNSSPNFDNLCGYKVIPFFKKMLIYLI